MTRIEAIRQRAAALKNAPQFLSAEIWESERLAEADRDDLLTLWDTRETALRALVERMTHQAVQLHPNDPVRVALKPHIEALSRLLEQEP